MDEPIELLFRPAVPGEQELIMALKAEAGVYGAVGEMLKAYIRRGYHILEAHARNGLQDGAHVDFEAAGAYRFKLLGMFHAANPDLEPNMGGHRAGPGLPRAQDGDPHALEVPAVTIESLEGEAGGVDVVASQDVSQVAAEPSPAPVRDEEAVPDWSRFRGIAAYSAPKPADQ